MTLTKILFVIEEMSGGGAEKVTSILANSFSAMKDFEVFLVTLVSRKQEYYISSEVNRISRTNLYHNKISEYISRYYFIKKTIKTLKPDYVISLSMYTTNILLTLGGIIRNYKLILSERNDPRRLPESRIKKIARDFSYYFADGMVIQTENVRDYFPAFLRNKAFVIPNPVESVSKEIADKREKKIITCSRLVVQKNIVLLLDSFAQIRKDFSDYTLHIWGEGPLKPKLVQHSIKLGIDNAVFFHDFEKDVIKKNSSAMVYVSTSDYEGISNSMLEALAVGMPVVCTDCPVGGARLAIIDGENGFLVSVGDKEKIIEVVERIICNEELAKRISINAAASMDRFSKEKISDIWKKYIERL
ncbi:glycosyltransferase family 4 protein [Butyrivibrio fibrisolvens]|uniref:Glycosyltransferase family 4 protein n=1 Tax=Butyrivibrio fibrisolvens TaxID=831 RepID=A0A317G0E7_BUTFI|nr:glycosyltransferase family 4 protein [Butyrivibrio fibrisolvens]